MIKKRSTKNQLIIILLMMLLPFILSAQTYFFKKYTTEDGLIQSQVPAVFQDKKGFMWFGTGGGISRFDGKSFKNFTTSEGLAGNTVTCIIEDQLGNIWIGTEGGISKCTPVGASDYQFFNITTSNGLPHDVVRVIFEDKNGNIWIGTNGGGLVCISKEDNKKINNQNSEISKSWFKIYNLKNGLVNARVWAVEEDKQGNIWIGTFNGLCVLPSENIDLKEQIDSTKTGIIHAYSTDELSSMRIYDIMCDKAGNLWCGTINGIRVITLGEKNEEIKNIEQLKGILIRSMIQDNKNNYWIATYGQGMAKIPYKTFNISQNKWDVEIFTTTEGLSSNLLVSILEDREGKLWIGNDESGVDKLNGMAFKAYTTKNGLKNDLVLSVVQDKNRNFIFSTFGGGVVYFVPKSNNEYIKSLSKPHTIVPSGFIYNITQDNGILNDNTYSIIEDSEDNIWIANFRKGLTLFRKKNNECLAHIVTGKSQSKFSYFTSDDILNHNTVLSIMEDSKKNIWLGSASGATKISKDSKGNYISEVFDTDDGLVQNFLYTVFEDSRGMIWFGTKGGGLSYLNSDSSSEKIKTIRVEDGLSNNLVRAIIEDASGNLWVGTNGGISLFRVKKYLEKEDRSAFENISAKMGLASDDIYSLMFDNDSSLWIGSSKGLDKFNFPEYLRSKKIEIKHYGKAEGFMGTETALNAVCKDTEGNLWFGTVGGAIQYSPEFDYRNAIEPLTHITRYRLFFRDTVMQQYAVLEYNKNHLTFDFIGISMTNPEKVKYRYKLEGFDIDWSPATKENFITYTNLHEGSYTFKVIACNNEEIWNNVPTSYNFSITPPFWRTWWFYLLCIFTTLVSISAFVRLRIKNLQEAKRILEAKVEERTDQLKVKNIELAQKNKDIIDSIKYAKRIQEAILPRTDAIMEALPRSFIIYKPKDIVSGDFYWFSKLKVKDDDVAIIAAVDCTGHGVPGAFMSMIGNDLLNHIVIENRIIVPGEILGQLHEGVKMSLKQTDQESKTKDGMDIGLCSIKYMKKEVEFSGAFRTLIVVSNEEFSEIKGDRYSIGGYQKDEIRTYKNHTLKLKTNDTIYIFSDGCVDQFGGKHNKKFMTRRLKETIMASQNLNMQDQAQMIEKSIADWQGSMEQTDDIIMIGIRF